MPYKIVRENMENVSAEVKFGTVMGDKSYIANEYRQQLELASERGCKSIAFAMDESNGDSAGEIFAVVEQFLETSDMQVIVAVSQNISLAGDEIYKGLEAYVESTYVEESAPGFGKSFMAELMDIPLFGKSALKSTAMAEEDDAMEKSRSLEDVVSNVGRTWAESLFGFIDEKGFSEIEVYKRANVDRKLFSKIRSNNKYQPKKNTAVAFALALRLNLDETKDFLARAGYALSPSSVFDLIIRYFIEQEVYDIYIINIALFEHGQQILGE